MAEFRRASDEQINTFEIDGVYLFKHFFDKEEVFDRLKPYYNNHQYRFEVPIDEFEDIRTFLSERGYGLTHIETTESFVVVVKKYTKHPENIFKTSIIQRTVNGYNCFLLKDQASVEEAVTQEAKRLSETELENPF